MSYWRGFVAAILMIELIAFGWLAYAAHQFRGMIAEFGAVEPPRIFLLVTSKSYALSCFFVLIGGAVWADRGSTSDTIRVVGVASVVFAGAVAIGVMYYGLYSPLNVLSAGIQ